MSKQNKVAILVFCNLFLLMFLDVHVLAYVAAAFVFNMGVWIILARRENAKFYCYKNYKPKDSK